MLKIATKKNSISHYRRVVCSAENSVRYGTIIVCKSHGNRVNSTIVLFTANIQSEIGSLRTLPRVIFSIKNNTVLSSYICIPMAVSCTVNNVCNLH